jgi:hypothetical protein
MLVGPTVGWATGKVVPLHSLGRRGGDCWGPGTCTGRSSAGWWVLAILIGGGIVDMVVCVRRLPWTVGPGCGLWIWLAGSGAAEGAARSMASSDEGESDVPIGGVVRGAIASRSAGGRGRVGSEATNRGGAPRVGGGTSGGRRAGGWRAGGVCERLVMVGNGEACEAEWR